VVDSFHVPVNDSDGHHEKFTFNLPGWMMSQTEKIVESKIFSYRDKGELIRHALKSHLDRLVSEAPVPSVMAQGEIIMAIVKDDENKSKMDEALQSAWVQTRKHLEGGRIKLAKALASEIAEAIDKMPEDSRYTAVWEAEFTDQFGDLVKDAGTPLLAPRKQPLALADPTTAAPPSPTPYGDTNSDPSGPRPVSPTPD
jgi:hypothetical protein